MEELKQYLTRIKTERDTKILPENIRKDLEVFGVTGELDEIMTQDQYDNAMEIAEAIQDGPYTPIPVPSSGDVKLFATISEMQNDENAKPGDMAVVYQHGVRYWDGQGVIRGATFPKTVVFDESVGSSFIMIQLVDEDADDFDFGHDEIVLTDSSFELDLSSVSINIRYSSSDGITYTRDDSGDEYVDFTKGIKISEMFGGWNELCGRFITFPTGTFRGLFEYEDNQYVPVKNQFSAEPNTVYNSTFLGKSGVEESGTLGVSTVDTFNSPSEKLFVALKDMYKNREKIVITDDNRGMFRYTDVVFIPNCLDMSGLTKMYDIFAHCSELKFVDISGCDLSNVTSMHQAFYSSRKLEEVRMYDIHTDSLESTERLFYECESLKEFDASSLNTSKVTNMANMFDDCYEITKINVSTLDTSKVTDFHSMFTGCFKLETVDVTNFDTSSAIRMDNMFSNCLIMKSIDLRNFRTPNVTMMNYMFHLDRELTELDLSSFDTSNVTMMQGMFYGCTKLTKIDMSNFTFGSVTSYTDMFKDVPANCQILVKDQTAKDWLTSKFTNLTNVQIKEVAN